MSLKNLKQNEQHTVQQLLACLLSVLHPVLSLSALGAPSRSPLAPEHIALGGCVGLFGFYRISYQVYNV